MDIKVCPVCQYENPVNALLCIKCGASFPALIAADPGTVTLRSSLPMELTKTEHEILLFVMDDRQPITLKNQKEIILGRKTVGEEPPTVDLSHYGENQLGVSRRHAAIEYQNEGYLLRDLGSSNGSWLNDTPLIPHRTYHLQSGDRFRLGQLTITVYFKETKPAETTFFIRSINSHMTVSELNTRVMPVLCALAELQKLADEILKRDAAEFGIQLFRVDETDSFIRIQTDKPVDVVRVIQDVVNPWKKKHNEETKQPLGVAFASKIKADLPPDERKIYAEKMLPLLQSLVQSPLEVSLTQAELT